MSEKFSILYIFALTFFFSLVVWFIAEKASKTNNKLYAENLKLRKALRAKMEPFENFNAALNWFANGEVGQSSKQLIAKTFNLLTAESPPRDADDRRRCILAIKKVSNAWLALDQLEIESPEWAKQARLIRQEFDSVKTRV